VSGRTRASASAGVELPREWSFRGSGASASTRQNADQCSTALDALLYRAASHEGGERGFARARGDHRAHESLVAFSCKIRWFCPSAPSTQSPRHRSPPHGPPPPPHRPPECRSGSPQAFPPDVSPGPRPAQTTPTVAQQDPSAPQSLLRASAVCPGPDAPACIPQGTEPERPL